MAHVAAAAGGSDAAWCWAGVTQPQLRQHWLSEPCWLRGLRGQGVGLPLGCWSAAASPAAATPVLSVLCSLCPCSSSASRFANEVIGIDLGKHLLASGARQAIWGPWSARQAALGAGRLAASQAHLCGSQCCFVAPLSLVCRHHQQLHSAHGNSARLNDLLVELFPAHAAMHTPMFLICFAPAVHLRRSAGGKDGQSDRKRRGPAHHALSRGVHRQGGAAGGPARQAPGEAGARGRLAALAGPAGRRAIAPRWGCRLRRDAGMRRGWPWSCAAVPSAHPGLRLRVASPPSPPHLLPALSC